MPIINMVDNAPKGFDVNAARQAGYSDDEIIQHLAGQQKFDASSALKAGYSKDELISHLASTPRPSEQGVGSKAWETINTPVADLAFGHGTTADYGIRAATGKTQAQLKAESRQVNDAPFSVGEKVLYGDFLGLASPSDRAAARTFTKGSGSDIADVAASFTSPLSIALLGAPKAVALAGKSLSEAKIALEGAQTARAAIEGTEGLSEADAAVQQAKTAYVNAQKAYATVRLGQGAVDAGFATQGGLTAAGGIKKYREAKTSEEKQDAIQETLMGGGMGLMGAYGMSKALRPGARPQSNVRPAEDVPNPMTGAFSLISSGEGFEPKRGPGVFEPFDQAATPLFHGERLAEPAFLSELGKGKPVKPQSIPGVNPDVDWETMIQHPDAKEGFTAKGSFDPISGEFKMYPEASEAVRTGRIRPEDEPPAPVQSAPEPPPSAPSGKAATFNVEKIAPAKAGDSTMHRMSITKEGKEVGHITGIADPASPGVLQIHDSELTNGERGNGLGTQAYKEFINHAKESGFSTLRSDSIVSPAASRVWESLKSKGYDVKQVMEGLSGKQYELRLQPEDTTAAIPKTDIAPPDISGMLKGPELDAYQSGQAEARQRLQDAAQEAREKVNAAYLQAKQSLRDATQPTVDRINRGRELEASLRDLEKRIKKATPGQKNWLKAKYDSTMAEYNSHLAEFTNHLNESADVRPALDVPPKDLGAAAKKTDDIDFDAELPSKDVAVIKARADENKARAAYYDLKPMGQRLKGYPKELQAAIDKADDAWWEASQRRMAEEKRAHGKTYEDAVGESVGFKPLGPLADEVMTSIDPEAAEGVFKKQAETMTRMKANPEAHAAAVVKSLQSKQHVSPEELSILEKSTGVALSGKTPERMIHDLNGWRNSKVLERAVRESKLPEPPEDLGAAAQKGTNVTRSKDFATSGEYEVTIGSNKYYVYRDTENGMWYEARTGKHYSQSWLGANKAEALKRLEERSQEVKAPPPDDPGTTLAMHLNPLTPITQAWTKYVGTPVWDMAKALLYKATPDYVIRKAFEKRYGQPAEYADAAQSRETTIELGQERANKLGKRMVGELSQEQQQQIGTIINGTATKEQVAAMRKNPALNDAVEAARLARRELDTLGGEAVVQGLLSEETFLKNYGKYMPRLYRQFELSYERLMNQFAQRVPNRIEMSRFKSREDIPENIRLLMGEVKEPGYPVAKGLTQMVHDVETAKLFNRVAQNPKWSFADPNGRDLTGFTKMPKSDRLGVLSERYVQTEIAEDINSMIHISSEGAKVVRGLMSEWKFGKVVANPPTHFRNMFANSVLNWLGGLPPTRVDIYYKALREMQDEGPMFQEAKQLGIMNNTFVRGELETMLDSWNKEPGGLFKKFAKIKQALSKGEVSAALNEIRPSQTELGRKMSNAYQAEEAWFKLAKYLHNKEKGMIPKEAAADATKWLFDYGDVPPWVQHLRQSPLGAPFLTFTYKAIPRVLESAVKAPWRIGAVIGLINYVNGYARKQLGMSQAEEDKVRAELPEKMRGGVGAPNQMLIPWKDKAGRLQFLDLSYTLPWGDIVEQGSGGMSSITPLMASPLRAAFEIGLNKSAYTKKQIWMDTDTRAERAEKATSYAWQQAVPPLAPGGYGLKKLTDAVIQRPDSQGIAPSRPGAIGAAIFGIRINPIDPKLDSKYREIERRQAVKEVAGQERKALRSPSLNPADRQAARDEMRDKLNNLKRHR